MRILKKKPEALRILNTEKLEEYKVDVVAVQEVRWEGSGVIAMRNHIFTVDAVTKGTGCLLNKMLMRDKGEILERWKEHFSLMRMKVMRWRNYKSRVK